MNHSLLYLEHLSDEDLDLVIEGTAIDRGRPRRHLIDNPHLIDELLSSPSFYRRLFDADRPIARRVSPFLVFAAIVHRVRRDLHDAPFVSEWAGPQRRLPVFDVTPLRDFLDRGMRRLFLTELLASFTRVASGTSWMKTSRGLRRRRFSELNPAQLAELAESAPPWRRPAVYRRLGDVALFLTGVFPDHTAQRSLDLREVTGIAHSARLELSETARLVGLEGRLGPEAAIEFFEMTGQRWYRRAIEEAEKPSGPGWMVVSDISGEFRQARRVLNVLTDRYLYRLDPDWMPGPV